MTLDEVLALPLTGNIKGHGHPEDTVRGYLTNLLYTLWDEEESFSGKKPLGDSGWQGDLFYTLIEGGAIPGTIDSDGYSDDYNEAAADALVRALIMEICSK